MHLSPVKVNIKKSAVNRVFAIYIYIAVYYIFGLKHFETTRLVLPLRIMNYNPLPKSIDSVAQDVTNCF